MLFLCNIILRGKNKKKMATPLHLEGLVRGKSKYYRQAHAKKIFFPKNRRAYYFFSYFCTVKKTTTESNINDLDKYKKGTQ
jgi:hypothetical protein